MSSAENTLTVRSGGRGQKKELCKEARFRVDLLAASRRADPKRRMVSMARVLLESQGMESRIRSRERSREDEENETESEFPRIVCRRWSIELEVELERIKKEEEAEELGNGEGIWEQGRFGKMRVSIFLLILWRERVASGRTNGERGKSASSLEASEGGAQRTRRILPLVRAH